MTLNQGSLLTQMVHALTCDLSISQGDLGAFITEQLARSMNFSLIGILFSLLEALDRVPAVIADSRATCVVGGF